MKKLFVVLLLVLVLTSPSYAALVKSQVAVDEWAEIAQNAVREGATTDVSDSFSSALHIDIALTSATAHTGTKIWVQVSSNSSGDEDWTTLVEFISPTGTANPEALTATEPIGETTLAAASTVGLYDDDEARWIFVEHTTVANSEMLLLVSHVANTSVTIQDGLTNEQTAAASTLFDIANNYVVPIPIDYERVRVIYDNTFDANGATVHCKTRLSKVTGL